MVLFVPYAGGHGGCGGHVDVNGTRYQVQCDPMSSGQKLGLALGLGLGLGVPLLVVVACTTWCCVEERWQRWRLASAARARERRYARLPGDIGVLAMLLDSRGGWPVMRRLQELDLEAFEAMGHLPVSDEAAAKGAAALLRAHAAAEGEDVLECHARWASELGHEPVMRLAHELLAA